MEYGMVNVKDKSLNVAQFNVHSMRKLAKEYVIRYQNGPEAAMFWVENKIRSQSDKVLFRKYVTEEMKKLGYKT